MKKIKQITLRIKKWQAGFALGVFAELFSYFVAVSAPTAAHPGVIGLFHLFAMTVSGFMGIVVISISLSEMWDSWDKEDA